MRSLIAHVYCGKSAHHGVIFGIPDRHRIFMHRISNPSAVAAINELASITAQHHENTTDGVSPNIYHWYRDRSPASPGPSPPNKSCPSPSLPAPPSPTSSTL